MNNYKKTSKTRRGELMCNGVSTRCGSRLGFSALCTLLFTFHVLHLNADVIDGDQAWNSAESITVGGSSYSGHLEYLPSDDRTYTGNVTANASNYSVVKSGEKNLALDGTNKIFRLQVTNGGVTLGKHSEFWFLNVSHNTGAWLKATNETVTCHGMNVANGTAIVDGAGLTVSDTGGLSLNSGGSFILDSGSVLLSGSTYAAYIGNGGIGRVVQNGGTFTVNERLCVGGRPDLDGSGSDAGSGGWGFLGLCGGEMVTKLYDYFGGVVAGATGTVQITGGTYRKTNGSIRVGYKGAGCLEVCGSGVLDAASASSIAIPAQSSETSVSGVGRVILGPGGTIVAKMLDGNGSKDSSFTFNGGTLKAAGTSPSFSGIPTVEMSELGGIVDTDGRNLTVSAAISKSAYLAHRWSFNGDLSDSVGGQPATMSGGELSGGMATLANVSGRSECIDLGAGVFPTDGSPVTVELWGKMNAANQTYQRMFFFGNEGNDTDCVEMLWVTDASGGDAAKVKTDRVAVSNVSKDSALAPYTVGQEFHIALVLSPSANGAWDVAAYKQDSTGATLAKTSFAAPAGWSPASISAAKCILGNRRSKDRGAVASYNEVRIWTRALTEAELALNSKAGPDSLPNEAFEKKGAGTLTLTGANTYVNDTVVSQGELSFAGGATLRAGSKVVIESGATLSFAGQNLASGTLVFNATASGVGTLVNTSGALDLSNLSLEVNGLDALPGRKYRIATSSGGFTGTFANATFLPRCSWKVSYKPDGVYIEKQGLMVIVL